ncbi:hypothetical protein DPMN_047582 [Dreissena polymorpha]|uniref:Uncharacterized protein n=1 Tax=Dreissena polymorpha TaxID=45954 RepID=A0A9D4DBP8_DREPO|nr:hypothetical protein DPMN_047582 [Dreissena polymorpha]
MFFKGMNNWARKVFQSYRCTGFSESPIMCSTLSPDLEEVDTVSATISMVSASQSLEKCEA